MFAKLFLVSAFIGYAAAACNPNDFQAKCGKYGAMMQEMSQNQQPDIAKMCCILNEQVTCINSLGCGDAMSQILTPAKAQIARMCGGQTYTPGCADDMAPEAESEAESGAPEKPDSGALSSAVPSLSLLLSLTALLRF